MRRKPDPRVYGGDCNPDHLRHVGRSPRVRGNRVSEETVINMKWQILACAGETL